MSNEICIVFDGPPAAVSGRFVEVERDGAGIGVGKWREHKTAGLWELVLDLDELAAMREKK